LAVTNRRIIVGNIMGAVIVSSLVVPAFGASDGAGRLLPAHRATIERRITAFTPASADPKLAALLARSGLNDSDFRFTPSESRRNGSRAVTVAVRARTSTVQRDAQRLGPVELSPGAAIGLAPIAYNLGVSVGWKRFALSGEVARLDLAGIPGSRESAGLGISYNGKRAAARLKAIADRPLANTPTLIANEPSMAIDVAGSYSLARNIDLTAGLRYKREENNRLERLTDNRRDSQAIYIGTALRF
jgi:outer membrane receptor protein involved in Fe transport